MKQIAPALLLSCVVGTHAWADAKVDCHQRDDWDRRLKGCTQYIEENHADQASRSELARAYVSRASAYMQKGDKDLAIADLTKAVEFDPQNALIYGLRGLMHFHKGEYDRAIADYTTAIELQPNAPARVLVSRYVTRGMVYQSMHNVDLAIADFRRALSISPDEARAKEWLTRLGATP